MENALGDMGTHDEHYISEMHEAIYLQYSFFSIPHQECLMFTCTHGKKRASCKHFCNRIQNSIPQER
jgi:hypothetical protein